MGSFKRVLKRIVPKAPVSIWRYRRFHGVFPRVFRPRTMTEKILHRMLFDRRPLLTRLSDKAAVRDYVAERAGPGLLPRLYLLTHDPAGIDFDALPSRFVVKPTHGSGWVRLVPDKAKLDRAELAAACRAWLRRSYFEENREWAYRDIPPRILIEELIDDGLGEAPSDYKLFTMQGRVAMIQVDVDRFEGHKRDFFDLSWKKIDLRYGVFPNINREISPPPHLAEMISAAETIARGIDFIRVDFYDTPEKLYFGEMATYPGRSEECFNPPIWDERLGALWRLPGA